MFSKAVVLVFLAIALSSTTTQAIPGRPPNQKSTSSIAPPPPAQSSSKGANGNNGSGAARVSNGNKGNQGNGNGNGNQSGACTPNGGDPQTSCTLDPKVIATGFEKNGQETPTAGQVASLTSNNNFINFCLTVNKPITNGQQIKGGSCNPAPMGVIASSSNMPSSKFVSPANLDTVKANTQFTVKMALNNLEAGNFVNADQNYYAAPQTVNGQGNIIGHTHFVIQAIDSLKSTKVLDPQVFAFFKGVNTPAAADGTVSVPVASGLPPGTYRLASINTAANHQPCVVAVAQHGSLDDQVYFTVTNDGKADSSNNNNPGNTASNPATSTPPPANGNGNKGNKGPANPGNNNGSKNPNSAPPAPSPSAQPSGNKSGKGKGGNQGDNGSGSPAPSSPAPNSGKGNGNKAGNPSSSSAPGRPTNRSFEIRRDMS